jgi:hypothetical protein
MNEVGNCDRSKRPLIEIYHYGERLVGWLNATAGAGEVATASLWNCRSKTLPRSDKRAMAKARVSYAW